MELLSQMPDTTKVVHDTSVILPILLRKDPESHRLFSDWQSRIIVPIVSPATIGELTRKLMECSETMRFGEQRQFAERKLSPYEQYTERWPHYPYPQVPRCQDPTDQQFLDLAYTGVAEYLVTEDKNCLTSKQKFLSAS